MYTVVYIIIYAVYIFGNVLNVLGTTTYILLYTTVHDCSDAVLAPEQALNKIDAAFE